MSFRRLRSLRGLVIALPFVGVALATGGQDGSEGEDSAMPERVTPLGQIETRAVLHDVPEAQRNGDWYEQASLRSLANRELELAVEYAATGAELGSTRAWAISAALRVRGKLDLPEIPVVLERLRAFDVDFARTRALFEWCASRRNDRLPDPDRVLRLRLHGPWPEGLGPKFGGRDRGSRERWFSAQRSSLLRALTAGRDESESGVRRLAVCVVPASRSLQDIAVEIEDASNEFPASDWLPVVLRVVDAGAPIPREERSGAASPRPFVAIDRPIVTALIDGHAPWSSPAFTGQRVWIAVTRDGKIDAVAPPGLPLELLSIFVRR